mmetsp:Transcript_3895/g.4517  ORF Transcript_3895/g.4517 Transcript_3895/m.4517 type:complete len:81 (-) Transcript_3895:692-934(-)
MKLVSLLTKIIQNGTVRLFVVVPGNSINYSSKPAIKPRPFIYNKALTFLATTTVLSLILQLKNIFMGTLVSNTKPISIST